MLAKTKEEIKRVAFMGDAEAKRFSTHFRAAFNTAYLLAKNGYIIVNGGGPGVMLAATLGAKKAKGRVEIAVLAPEKSPENYEGVDKRNVRLADKMYVMHSYENRMGKLKEIADAFVFFKGGTGTLSEMGLVWEEAKCEGKNYEPLIFYGTFWKKILDKMKELLPLTKDETSLYGIAKNSKEVLKLIKMV